jgi:type I restriction enzyme S subunit
VFYITKDFWPLNTTLYVHNFKGNDPRFISYLLRSLDFLAYSDKAAVPGLNRNHLHTALVRVPTNVAEQCAIAHILGTLDDKIELNRRMNETLEAMARALFQSWFVDFEPVRAKAEGRDPGLPKPIADLFPDRFEDSELGEIPAGWRCVPLPEVIEVNPPRTLRKGMLAPYLDMANMPTRGHTPDAVIERPFGSGMRFMNGDTLVARITPCLENGKAAYVDFLGDGQVGWGSTEYIVFRPKPPLPNEFAHCLARSAEFREFAIQSMTGSSGRQRVPAESLVHFLVVSPSQLVAELFGTLIRPLFARAAAATAESRTLAALRDILLPKLISGELRVKDTEPFIGSRTS